MGEGHRTGSKKNSSCLKYLLLALPWFLGVLLGVSLLAVALKVQMQLRAGKGVESEDCLGRGFPWNTMENEM